MTVERIPSGAALYQFAEQRLSPSFFQISGFCIDGDIQPGNRCLVSKSDLWSDTFCMWLALPMNSNYETVRHLGLVFTLNLQEV